MKISNSLLKQNSNQLYREMKTDKIVEQVLKKYKQRSEVGIKKYGTTLQENNNDNFLLHLQQELMDASLYVEKLMGQDLQSDIEKWADDRNILKYDNRYQQFAKMQEEAGELAKAMLENDKTEIIDALGDTYITLVILAAQMGLSLKQCSEIAFNEIKNRKGKTENGTFIREKHEANF